MLLTAFSVLVPILFVIGLGYFAGRSKKFDADQVQGLNELVLTYALPALLFVATVNTTRSQMLAEGPFVAAIVIAFLGLYIAVVLVSTLALRHPIGAAALQAVAITFPSVAFFGIPIFKGLFGESSLLSIATANIVGTLLLVPVTVVLMEIHKQRTMSADALELRTLIRQALLSSFSKPMVWAPLVRIALVLLDIDPPPVVDNAFALIGSTTGGASIFLAGLVVASCKIRFDREIIANVIGKMILQPVLMALLVMAFGIGEPLGREAILICAIPTTVLGAILAPRYKVYETESASSMVLSILTMIVTFPIAILLTGG